jgi:predicted alpha/beta-hydrolase family hydrolase
VPAAGVVASELRVPTRGGEVSALWQAPGDARAAFVLAHGAGAGMRQHFMEAIAARLAARRIATLRYQFPYMERRGGRPDPQPILLDTVRAAIDAATAHTDLPLVAGGKSMGGRMTTLAAAEGLGHRVRGIVLLGFPLHPAGRPGTERAAHLDRVRLPMLFLQGTRDALADLERMRATHARIAARATLEIVEDADHSFHVRKASGRDDQQVLDLLADRIAAWTLERV